jgi:aminoglycoside 3-N-acetyltransferase I
MSLAIEVRRLGAGDLAAMRALNGLFGAVFGEPETYGGAPPDDAWLGGLLAKDHVIALTAEVDGALAGGLVAYELDKFEQARREIYIYDLAVDEARRRRGVATALIGAVQAIAAARGAWVVYVQADYQDAPAVALYDKLGAREEVLHFDLPPAPAAADARARGR